MGRATVAVLAFALVLALAPTASAMTCSRSGSTVTVTFPAGSGAANDQGTLSVTGGGEIRADNAACSGGGATTANTDAIVVDYPAPGDAGIEQLTLDVANPFAPGATDEGDGSSEIEITVNVGTNSGAGNMTLRGGAGADAWTVGEDGPTKVNLNAGEAGTDDADLTVTSSPSLPTFNGIDLRSLGGADVISSNGGDGTGSPYTRWLTIETGDQDDQVTLFGGEVKLGAGSDTLTPVSGGGGWVSYQGVNAPIQVNLGTGATLDGQGGSDTFTAPVRTLYGTNFADQITGTTGGDSILGWDGLDTVNAGDGADVVNGGSGNDVLNGGGDADRLDGAAGDDDVFGDGGNDDLRGSIGADDLFGGDGDDSFDEWINDGPVSGADDLDGGGGTDTARYAEERDDFFGVLGRSAPVTVDLDGVADDGAAGEGDNVLPNVENIVGGLANDTLVGDGDANVLSGFGGADTLRGGGGGDTLLGLGSTDPEINASITDGGDDIDGEGGGDAIAADEGDDRIEARDGAVDTIDCGAGTDTGRRDGNDPATACEDVAPLGIPNPGSTQTTTTTTPAPIVAPVIPPAVIPRPPVLAPLPAIGTLVTQPSTRRCVSRRRLRIALKRATLARVRGVEVLVNGRRKARVSGAKLRVPVDLRGLPRGTFRVALRITLVDGRTVTDTRRYRTCASRRRS